MFRRLVALCLLSVGLAACGDSPADLTAGQAEGTWDYWVTEPATDADRLELLRRTRNIDPCALMPREALAEYGTVLRMFTTSPGSCTATLNSEEKREQTEFDLSVSVRNPGVPSHAPEASVRMVDGAEVTSVRDLDHLDDRFEDQILHRSCTVTAGFPSQVSLMLFSSNPLGTEPCPIAENVIDTALGEFGKEPVRGSSPDTARTVVDGIDPCAAAAALGVTVPAAQQSDWSCEFTYRDDEISVWYGYDWQSLTPDAPLFTVGPHPVHRVDEPGDDFVSRYGRIGPPLETAEEIGNMGPRLPTVNVMGKDADAVEDVVRQALLLVPAR
ncbi:hypothetical protein [Nocardia carnea]|uniref:DUF3558 domain-containing protein n=1 Tax=Nocardia carnea TaxID=37328 RepID=A0ABW7TDY4_9NOCA|nr:hypothetical protein [Nocardia carnea]